MKTTALRTWLRFAAVLTACASLTGSQRTPEQIRTQFEKISTSLAKHLVQGQWIDDSPEAPALLEEQWSLVAEWLAAKLNAKPSATPGDVQSAVAELTPSSDRVMCMALKDSAFLVSGPGPIGNVFIVAKRDGRYQKVWSTADVQTATGRMSQWLAAWRAENARIGERGPYRAASDRFGPVYPRIGRLPPDSSRNSRFYIGGIYAQAAGGTVGAQITLWLWDGIKARPLLGREYAMMIDQKVGIRLEGDLLKVQQKKRFRSFYSCGMCEERQTDWIVRIARKGVFDIGEKPAVPELDAIDELVYQTMNGRPATSLASPAAIRAVQEIVSEARDMGSEQEWKEFPTLGMMQWSIRNDGDHRLVCVAADKAGATLFRIQSRGRNFFIDRVTQTAGACER